MKPVEKTAESDSVVASLSSRFLAAAGVLTILGGSVFVALNDPTKAGFFPPCPLLTLTGFACPGCGLTRGFHALFHGDIVPALDFNLLLPVWAVVFTWVVVSLALLALRGRALPMWPTYPKVLSAFVVILICFGVLRNVPVWPLTILFP
ncbi:MAG: DUF2752 domain-containing protein [Pyrinomonadaceae bacterium]